MRQRLLFSLIPVTTLFVSAEVLLRCSGFRYAAAFIEQPIFEPDGDGNFLRTTPMFTDTEPYGFPFCRNQRFTRENSGGMRIIIVGGSSVFHLGDAPLLAQSLRRQLETDVEIINAAFQGCGSERVLRAVREAVAYAPDVVVIYAGHNEFVSFANPATRVDRRGRPLEPTQNFDVRVIQFLSKLRHKLVPPSPRALSEMERLYSQSEKDKFYQRFRRHLFEMVEVARAHGTRVVLSTVSYNYAVPPTRADGYDKIEQLLGLADSALRAQHRRRPNNAFIEYAIGTRAHQRGEYVESKNWFDKALLHDKRPYRADTTINKIIQDVARERNVPLAEVNDAVSSQHPHAIPDFTFFSDHCHLNDLGNKILQQTVADTIVNAMPRR